MNAHYPYSSKAAKYARYRWEYASRAVQTLYEVTGIGNSSTVADIGAGTGILTRHFVDKVKKVYAVEPDPEMRAWLLQVCGRSPSLRVIDGSAEATTLPTGSVDMISAAQALHWFNATKAQREFRRILKADGWLAVLWNQPISDSLSARVSSVFTAQHGWDVAKSTAKMARVPAESYFDREGLLSDEYPVSTRESWEHFFGGLCSDSHAPLESDPAYPGFAREVRSIFDDLAVMGTIEVTFVTHLLVGKLIRIESWQREG